MIIEYKFYIGQVVKIKELDHKGRVITLWTAKKGNEIQVRYCTNGEYRDVYFFEDELEAVDEIISDDKEIPKAEQEAPAPRFTGEDAPSEQNIQDDRYPSNIG